MIGKNNNKIVWYEISYLVVMFCFALFYSVNVIHEGMNVTGKGKVENLLLYSDAETIKEFHLKEGTTKKLRKQLSLVKGNMDALFSFEVDKLVKKCCAVIGKRKEKKLRDYLHKRYVEDIGLYFMVKGYKAVIKEGSYKVPEKDKELAKKNLFSYLIHNQGELCCEKISYVMIGLMKKEFLVDGEVSKMLEMSIFRRIVNYFKGNV